MLIRSSIPPFDLFVWLIVAILAALGGCLGGGVVLAWQHAKQSPALIGRVAGMLAVLSLFFLAPSAVDEYRAREFLARTDSTRGIISAEYRGGFLIISYLVGPSRLEIRDRIRPGQAELGKSDSVRVYYDPEAPASATIWRPGPDWRSVSRQLAAFWAIGGVLLLGYGVVAESPGVPAAWRPAVRLVRAYVGAAAAGDLGYTTASLLHLSSLGPSDAFSDAVFSRLAIGAPVSLGFTLVLGTIGWLVLQERRWTGIVAYGACGGVFGAVGGLWVPPAPAAVLPCALAGVLAGLAFHQLYYRRPAALEDLRGGC